MSDDKIYMAWLSWFFITVAEWIPRFFSGSLALPETLIVRLLGNGERKGPLCTLSLKEKA